MESRESTVEPSTSVSRDPYANRVQIISTLELLELQLHALDNSLRVHKKVEGE